MVRVMRQDDRRRSALLLWRSRLLWRVRRNGQSAPRPDLSQRSRRRCVLAVHPPRTICDENICYQTRLAQTVGRRLTHPFVLVVSDHSSIIGTIITGADSTSRMQLIIHLRLPLPVSFRRLARVLVGLHSSNHLVGEEIRFALLYFGVLDWIVRPFVLTPGALS